MDSERRINNFAGNQILLRRGFSHLGALALNKTRASTRTRNTVAPQSRPTAQSFTPPESHSTYRPSPA